MSTRATPASGGARSAVVVAHKYLTQPDDELVVHLRSCGFERILHVCHSFSDAPDRRSYYRLYRGAALVREARTRDYARWPEPLVYLKEVLFTLRWVVGLGGRWDLYVGMDGLCVLAGNFLRALGRVRRTIYWAIDYVPENRFASRWKNAVYSAVNNSGYRNADEVWDLSPRMAEARSRFGRLKPSDYRSNRVVPYGIWPARIPRVAYDECDRHTLVFMGHLLEKQGVQLVIRAIPEVVRRLPEFRFKIIGGGSYGPRLSALAAECGVAERCSFLGRIERIEDLEREVARSAAGIAPYIRELDTWTAYADPGKVKTYLACGLPVLLTDVPWNARDIEAQGCGRVISEERRDIVEAILWALEPARNREMRAKALDYAKGFAWETIFAQALGRNEGAAGAQGNAQGER